jgi:hypothetical protein
LFPPKTNVGLSTRNGKAQIMRMNLLVLTGIAAAGCAVAIGAAGVAEAAESAALTIGELQAQGFDVQVSRVGSAPLDRCVVTDVRNPREQTRLVRRGDDLVREVVARRISVTVDCSR